MDYYFFIITIIDVFVLGIMCILTKYSEVLDIRQRRWFIRSFLLIICISLLEVVTVVVDKRSPSFRWMNIVANYLGFGLSPAVPICLSAALEENQSNKCAILMEVFFLLFLAISFPFKTIFYVDHNNQYIRGDFFAIYLAAYFSGILYLLIMTHRVMMKYQNKSKRTIYPIAAFLLACTMIQVSFSHIHISWLCVSLLAILFFIYCNGMWQQLDNLTGLLNQKSYLNTTASLSNSGILVVFDVDDFKLINDNYGHLLGDKCLEVIADCIKKVYSDFGFCYRIGGDEFCVLLESNADEKECYRKLINELETRRKTLPVLPHVSVGSAAFIAGDNVLKVKEAADKELYRFKKENKSNKL